MQDLYNATFSGIILSWPAVRSSSGRRASKQRGQRRKARGASVCAHLNTAPKNCTNLPVSSNLLLSKKNVFISAAAVKPRFVKNEASVKAGNITPRAQRRAGVKRPSSCFGDSDSEDVFVHSATRPAAIFLGYKRIFWFSNVSPNSY